MEQREDCTLVSPIWVFLSSFSCWIQRKRQNAGVFCFRCLHIWVRNTITQLNVIHSWLLPVFRQSYRVQGFIASHINLLLPSILSSKKADTLWVASAKKIRRETGVRIKNSWKGCPQAVHMDPYSTASSTYCSIDSREDPTVRLYALKQRSWSMQHEILS